MGGGKKKQLQEQSQNVAAQGVQDEQKRSVALQSQLDQTKSNLTNQVYGPGGSNEATGDSAKNLAVTGGYDPAQVSKIQGGYQNMADTGGYSDAQKQDFVESAVAPTIATYGRNRDELTRHMAVNGGYNPGFTSSEDRLNRHEAQDISSANMGARTNLATQIQSNKVAGLQGLQTSASGVASGKVQGQDALQRYNDSGVSALNQQDIIGLQDRAQKGAITMQDSQLLALLASQNKSLYDQIMQGVTAVGGAVGGVAGGFNA